VRVSGSVRMGDARVSGAVTGAVNGAVSLIQGGIQRSTPARQGGVSRQGAVCSVTGATTGVPPVSFLTPVRTGANDANQRQHLPTPCTEDAQERKVDAESLQDRASAKKTNLPERGYTEAQREKVKQEDTLLCSTEKNEDTLLCSTEGKGDPLLRSTDAGSSHSRVRPARKGETVGFDIGLYKGRIHQLVFESLEQLASVADSHPQARESIVRGLDTVTI
jgi:hypothetical protein